MRIAIDARLNAYRRGGIPEYTRQLVTAMAPLAQDDTLVLLQHSDHQRPLVVAPNVRRRSAITPPHNRFEQLTLPLELLALRPDLLHSPDFVAPRRRPCPAVVTVHDLAFMHYPEILDDEARRYYNQVRASVHNAQAVIAVSQATRNDIVELLELAPERVDVVYEAASPDYRPLELEPGATRTLGGHTLHAGSFGLFVSTLEPRKNLPTLLKALRLCSDRRPSTPFRLAVAGARGWHYQGIFDAVRELRLNDAVLFLDNVGPDDLRWLYNACVFYANPSLYEGFGLPVLEALACGAPTIVSATSSLPELVGDGAALLLPPLDEAAWADAIDLLWHSPDRRAALAAAGPAQAARFSWQQAAHQTLAIYRRAAGIAGEAAPLESFAPATPAAAPLPAAKPAPPPTAVGPPRSADNPPIQAAPHDGAPRPCMRCGAALEAGALLSELRWHAQMQPAGAAPAALRAWACGSCGSVELVLEPRDTPAHAVEKRGGVGQAVLEVEAAATEARSSDPYSTQQLSPEQLAAEEPDGPPLPETTDAELPAAQPSDSPYATQVIAPLPEAQELGSPLETVPDNESIPPLPEQASYTIPSAQSETPEPPAPADPFVTQVLALPPEQPPAPEQLEAPLPDEAAPAEPLPDEAAPAEAPLPEEIAAPEQPPVATSWPAPQRSSETPPEPASAEAPLPEEIAAPEATSPRAPRRSSGRKPPAAVTPASGEQEAPRRRQSRKKGRTS
jgi:glycosyltransferase involved in cell wall biosynthesis